MLKVSPLRADADRRDHRNDLGLHDRVQYFGIDLFRLADKAQIDRPCLAGQRVVLVSASLRDHQLPSLPDRPTARPPAALMPVTICLLIEPVSTISTTSTAAWSVTRSPSMKRRWNVELLEHGADLRPAAMHHDRIDAGLLHQDDVLGEIVGAAAGHGVAAELHHDGLLVVFENVGQRFDQHARRSNASAPSARRLLFLSPKFVRERHGADNLC